MAFVSEPIVRNMLLRLRQSDPATADAIDLIINEISRLANEVDPPPTVPRRLAPVERVRPAQVTEFSYELTRRNIIFRWSAPQSGFLLYELRTNSTAFNDGDRLLTTGNLEAIIDPALVVGGLRVGREGENGWTIKAINAQGEYSTDEGEALVNIPHIVAPVITPNVINNFVLLNWAEPSNTTFDIDYYVVKKDGVTLGSKVRSTFYAIQEQEAGEFTYSVTAFDIAGNESDSGQITIVVTGPTDFEIQDELSSILDGTIVNGKVENNKLYVCIDTTITIEDHFDDNLWATPQAQIDAGYPLWIQPTETTASYEEVFDFGTIYTNVIVNISYLFELLNGSFTFGLDIRVSDDDITYSSPFTTPSFFASSARYIKVHIDFTSADDEGLLAFSDLMVSLSVKREADGGEEDVLAADGAGTVIAFNKAFKFVESITLTALDTNVATTTYDFAGGANPTDFKAFAWDIAGNRIDATLSWKARGVL